MHVVLAVRFRGPPGKVRFQGTLADRIDNDDTFEATLCIDVRRQHGNTSLEREIVRRFANGVRA